MPLFGSNGDFKMTDTEVVINRVGDSLIITPKSALEGTFYSGIEMFTADFLAEGRPEETSNGEMSLQ